MQSSYVDDFFANGRLQLSCFFQFKKRESEETGDRWEGWNLLIGAAADQTVAGVVEYGANALVLSTTAVHNTKLYDAFQADACFRINDTRNFGAAIAAALGGFQSGFEGPCSYQEDRLIERSITSLDMEALKNDPNSLGSVMAKLNEIAGVDGFFIKHARFSHQAEYRFIWNVTQLVKAPLVIECRNALQFCVRTDRSGKELRPD